jgi:glycosyltransferase involved in cell wall biosynthesis
MKPRITALIDTYNHEPYIKQTLHSVLDQGLSAEQCEIVVVDDGSTDNTASIVETFGPRVKLVRKKNGGQASAFNAGFAVSTGEIIAFLDGDDWWAKGKLQTVLKAFDENPSITAVGHGHFEFDETTQVARECRPTRTGLIKLDNVRGIQDAWSAWGSLLMGSLTVRRSLLEWLFPLPEVMVFMADTPIQVAAMFSGTLLLDETLFYYRQHGQNLFAIDKDDKSKSRRRSEMAQLALQRTSEMLITRGVEPKLVWGLLLPPREHWFQFDPPTRLTFFWYLQRLNYWRRGEQSWRFTALNAVAAFAALFFGYARRNAMYGWRLKATEDAKRWYRRAFAG